MPALFAALPALALAQGAGSQSSDARTGVLTVHITSTSGTALPGGRLSVYPKRGQPVSWTGVRGERTVQLPYGDYTVGFEAEFLKPVKRQVTIDRPETFLVLATNMADTVLDLRHEPVAVSLSVQPPAACTPGDYLWAKLTGVFADYASERKIGPFGYAVFEPLEVGTYVVTVVEGRTVRAIKPVATWGEITVVDIQLPACRSARPNESPLDKPDSVPK